LEEEDSEDFTEILQLAKEEVARRKETKRQAELAEQAREYARQQELLRAMRTPKRKTQPKTEEETEEDVADEDAIDFDSKAEKAKQLKLFKKLQEQRIILDEEIEIEKKSDKKMGSLFEMVSFVGIIGTAILSIIVIGFFAWQMLTGQWANLLGLGVDLVAVIAFVMAVVYFYQIRKAGAWHKAGLWLATKKGQLVLKFPRSGTVIPQPIKKAKLQYFSGKNKETQYVIHNKGYIDLSTGGTVYTAREGEPTDFDVNRISGLDLRELGISFSNMLGQKFDAGIIWNKTKKDLLLILVIVALLASIGACIVGAANYMNINDTTTKLDGKLTALQEQVGALVDEKVKATGTNPSGANSSGIVAGG